jgi:hypothetical protein
MIYIGHFDETDIPAISFTAFGRKNKGITPAEVIGGLMQRVRKSTLSDTGFTRLTKGRLDAADRRRKNG